MIPGLVLLLLLAAFGQNPAGGSDTFAPFEEWRTAVLSGNASVLNSFYRSDPPVDVRVDAVKQNAAADIAFWLSLKPRSMTVEVVRNEPRRGHISFIFRSQVVSGDGKTIVLTDDQSWQEINGQWRLISVERTDSPKLAQPANMKKNLYPPDADAHSEIKEAEEKAEREHKRLLLVFGANWCFDCHVLDLAFQRPDLAPIVAANYEVVHIDLGPEEEKNADLVHQYEIPLNKGIPALAIAESDGRLVVSQKNGEFEDARGLTPEALAKFLNEWKPQKHGHATSDMQSPSSLSPLANQNSFSSKPNGKSSNEEQALLVYIRLSDGQWGTDAETGRAFKLEDELISIFEQSHAGEFDGDEIGGGFFTLYVYGPNAQQLWNIVAPALRRFHPPVGSYAIKRYGKPGAGQDRVDLPEQG